MANQVVTNIDGTNAGPGTAGTVNTQSPYSTLQFIQTIQVSLTPVAIATATTTEQSYGANGVSYVSAITGIRASDQILAVEPPSTVTGVGLAGFRNDPTTTDKFYLTWVTTGTTLTPPAGVYLITVARYNLSNTANLPTALV